MYLNVLNKYEWVEYANAISQPHSDSGLFGFYFQAPANKTSEAIKIMAEEAKNMCAAHDRVASCLHLSLAHLSFNRCVPAGAEELARAKTQMNSMIHFNLESRATRFEDLGSQVLEIFFYFLLDFIPHASFSHHLIFSSRCWPPGGIRALPKSAH